MPFQERSIMSLRYEFVELALHEGSNMRDLCRRYGVTAKTGYKWLRRYQEQGCEGLADLSRAPKHSPLRTPTALEQSILDLRDAHPAWGGRKLARRLCDLGQTGVPAPSTITEVLRRHGRLDPKESAKHCAFTRFEHPAPNDLWQMDFKGHFALAKGRCHPLTILDDHSRFSLCLQACADEQSQTVQEALTQRFRLYGLPRRMLMDNGAPWGTTGQDSYSGLELWLIRLGVAVSHGRAYHPQTQGKEERFHRTLVAEVLRYQQFDDLTHCQRGFDRFRDVYNHERPHEAIEMRTPSSRYQPSKRAFPETLPLIEYGPDDAVRKVQKGGVIHYQGQTISVSKALQGMPVGLRPTNEDGVCDVYFCAERIATVDLRETNPQ